MKQIYINNLLGTIRIDYDENKDGDIIIVTNQGVQVKNVIQEHIETSGIDPQTIEVFRDGKARPLWPTR